MANQRACRRPDFRGWLDVVLADGESWSLPAPRPDGEDPEFDALFRSIMESEDRDEFLRLELALTIFLLTRNYDLTPDEITSLLSFPPGDPGLVRLQEDIRAFVIRSVEWNSSASTRSSAFFLKLGTQAN